MVTVALLPLVTPLGSDDGSIIRLNVSDISRISSSVIVTLNVTSLSPAGIVTLYGPGVKSSATHQFYTNFTINNKPLTTSSCTINIHY